MWYNDHIHMTKPFSALEIAMNKKHRLYMSVLAAITAFVLTANQASLVSDAVFGSSITDTKGVKIVIDTHRGRKPISRYIYGLNDRYDMSGVNCTAAKQTGSILSTYNWEINAANSGVAGNFKNDFSLVSSYSDNNMQLPALYTDSLISKAKKHNIPSRYVTLQMMGFAANDGQGAVNAFDTEHRWASVYNEKNDALLVSPNTHDNAVYMDEYLSFMANTYGFAADGGINGYFLDTEPELWAENYAILGLQPLTAEELIEKSVPLASTVKRIDPTALVYGPSVKNLEAYVNLNNPADWEQHSGNYSWFLDFYLDKMRLASEKSGTRLLDVLDLHFITEAKSVILEPVIGTDSKFANEERIQATRVLWDSDYTENSDTAILYKQHTPIIPTVQASIRMYYPDTKLSFSEYNFGGGDNISGGIAQADVLGIFAEQDVYMACLLPDLEDYSYQKSGINIYTDYDGNGASFGNVSVYSDNGGDNMSSVHAAVTDGEDASLKAVLINKNGSNSKNASVSITSDTQYSSANIYRLDDQSSEIVFDSRMEEISDNSFEFDMSPLTVYVFEFESEHIIDEENIEDTTEPPVTEEPEHVEISTNSELTTLPDDETGYTETTTSVSVIGTDEEGEEITEIITEPPQSDTDNHSKKTEKANDSAADSSKKTPLVFKIFTFVILFAVIAVMIYVLASDNKRSKK